MTPINRWSLGCQNLVAPAYQFVQLFYDEPSAPCAAMTVPPGSYFTVQNLGNGQIFLQFLDGAANPFATLDYNNYRLQFQDPNGNWNTFGTPFQPIPTGDGYFVLYARGFGKYVTISPNPDPRLVGCYRLLGGTSDLGLAARLTATGLDRKSIFDFLQVGKNATGLSFAGADLTNHNLSGDYNLSLCDFREVTSLSGCVLDGTHLQKATFAGLHLGGLQISGADCTGADFTGCDFTSFAPGTPPPVLTQANLTRAVIPGGNSWSGAQMAGAVLAGANLTGCDLSGPATDLSGADFVGLPVVSFTPVFNPPGGIGSYNQASAPDQVILASPADQVIAFDYNGTGDLDHLLCYRPGTGMISILAKEPGKVPGTMAFNSVFDSASGIGGWDLAGAADRIIAYDYNGTGHLDHLVCYRPGTGAIAIIQKNSDDTFGHVYLQGDPGGGIGGWALAGPADRIIAYDYNGTGHADHLLCYQPGTGVVSIIEEQPQTPGTATFGKVFDSTGGIGGYNLASLADQIIAYGGAGKPEHMVCYRPGGLTICIIEEIEETATLPPTLIRCDLSGANLSGVDLRGFDLTTTKLAGANLSRVQFPGAVLSGVDLSGATLVGTDFTGLDLTAVRFSSPLNQSTDPDNPTIFANCTLPYTVIGLDWSWLDLTATTITGLPTDLTGLVATGMRRPGADFDSFILDGANFSNATLDNAHFAGAKLRLAQEQKVTFAGARLTGAHFTGAVLDQVQFAPAALGGVSLNQAATFSFAFISNCDFTGSNLYGVSFASATLLSGNVLAGATSLQQASFANAYLPNADFTGANLQGAKFDGAFMVECVLTKADLTPADEGAIAASLTSACLQAAALQGTKLDGADLTDAAITNAKGQINQQYHDENGNLTPMFAMRFPAGVFPAPSSFSDNTTCPDSFTYGTDINNGKTMEQMMTAENPPTQWKPVGVPDDWRRS